MKQLTLSAGLLLLLSSLGFGATTRPSIQLEPVMKPPAEKRDRLRLTSLTNDGTKRLYITDQDGHAHIIENGQLVKPPVLDLSSETYTKGECGLLSLAFHPKYAANHLVYAYYINKVGGTWATLAEFKADPETGKIDSSTERDLVKFDEKKFSNHKGGQLQFGPDGFLYMGTGDGGSQNDPNNNGQNLKSPLGKMHRFDVDKRDADKPYAIPADNPFVGNPDALPEIYAYGLRNPWRFSFDRATGELYVGDVGQDTYEEVDLITKGGNYGWRGREGFHPNPTLKRTYAPGVQEVPGALDPIVEYPHQNNDKSITGGYVYRGKAIPDLVGWYIYGDYSSGRIWGLQQKDGKLITNQELLLTKTQPSAFGVDSDGEMYVVDYNGGIYKIIAGGQQ